MVSQVRFGEYVLDISRKKLLKDGEMVGLSPKAVELLTLLIERRGEVVTREQIMDQLWGDVIVEDGNISFQISCLRKVLGQNGTLETQYIRTVPKKGYSFIAEVAEMQDAPLPASQSVLFSRWAWAAGLALVLSGVAMTIASSMWRGLDPNFVVADDFSRKEAQALYAKARHVWESRVFNEQDPSVLLLQAIERDPSFVDARVLLADTYAFDATPERAEAALKDARSLSGETGSIVATEAFVKMFHYWDWKGAEQAFNRAIELDPHEPKARHWYGVYLSLNGDLKGAKRQIEIAAELKPESLIIAADRAQIDYFEGNLYEAARRLEAVLKIEPRFTMARRYLAIVREAQGLEAEAFEHRMSAFVRDTETVAKQRETFLRSGLRGLWLEAATPSHCEADPYGCAMVYAKLDIRDKALTSLKFAIDKRAFEVPYLLVDPVFANLRQDPEFASLVSRVKNGS